MPPQQKLAAVVSSGKMVRVLPRGRHHLQIVFQLFGPGPLAVERLLHADVHLRGQTETKVAFAASHCWRRPAEASHCWRRPPEASDCWRPPEGQNKRRRSVNGRIRSRGASFRADPVSRPRSTIPGPRTRGGTCATGVASCRRGSWARRPRGRARRRPARLERRGACEIRARSCSRFHRARVRARASIASAFMLSLPSRPRASAFVLSLPSTVGTRARVRRREESGPPRFRRRLGAGRLWRSRW